MPSALFEIYQKNFEKSLKKLSERLELYQKQSKEAQSITLTEAELNISEMERAISQMDMEVIIEKIPDNKKKLNKIIEANKNIVKQYKREIQDLKYKEQSILNKKNFAKIYSNKNNQKTELNLLKEKNNNFISDDEDISLFINKNSSNDINIFNNDSSNNIGENKENNIIINNTNDIDFFYNFTNYNGNFNTNNNKIKIDNKINKENNIKEIEDKDAQDNKYKIIKNNNKFNKIYFIFLSSKIYSIKKLSSPEIWLYKWYENIISFGHYIFYYYL